MTKLIVYSLWVIESEGTLWSLWGWLGSSGSQSERSIYQGTWGHTGDDWVMIDDEFPLPETSTSTTRIPTTVVVSSSEVVAALTDLDPERSVLPPIVVKAFHPHTVASFGVTMRRLIKWQDLKDQENQRSVPLLENDVEFPVLDKELVQLTISGMVARQELATVFRSDNHGGYVIKYNSDCENPHSFNPILRDWAVMSNFMHTAVTPKVYFLSPAVALPRLKTPKTDFTMTSAERELCIHRGGTVRYLVMEKGYASLSQVMRQVYRRPLSLRETVSVMLKTLRFISELHSRGIIHGDIHSGNVLLMNAKFWDIRLIDFGASIFSDELDGLPDKDNTPMNYVHPLLTHWNMEDGYRYSYRDDVYRTLWMGASLMNGPHFDAYFTNLAVVDPPALVEFKKSSFIFTYPGESVDVIPPHGDIRTHLEKALRLARSVATVHNRPPYGAILEELRHVAQILKG